MFVVKNAWKSVTRNKGRNMLIIVIVTIIAAAATIGLSIRQAAARSSGLDNTTATAQISLDRGKLISESREQSKSDSDSSDASAKPDFDAMRSALADIPGIGEAYQKRLLNHFGSVRAMREASVEDFEQVKGIGHAKAENIYQALHSSVDIASKAEDALRTVKSDGNSPKDEKK